MTDGESITRLMNLYALAIDAKRFELFDQVFTTDVQADYMGQRWDDLESWQKDFETTHQIYNVTEHLILNVMWNVSGDSGTALSRCHFHLIREGHSGRDGVAGASRPGPARRPGRFARIPAPGPLSRLARPQQQHVHRLGAAPRRRAG